MLERVSAESERRMRARGRKRHLFWFGLGMLGLVGWSIVLPTLLGVAAGLWIQERWATGFPWVLVLLLAGLGLGCANAWRWVHQGQQSIVREREERRNE